MKQNFTQWISDNVIAHTGPINEATMEVEPKCGYGKSQCFERLMLVLDKEASPAEQQVFIDNISRCMACYERLKLEHGIKYAIATKMVPVASSPALIADIRAQIAALE